MTELKINKIRVRNFRSIKNEVVIEYDDLLFVVGPNNSGKTNLLKAIQYFFESYKVDCYQVKGDLSFDVEGGQTSIIVSFSSSGANWEKEFLDKYNNLLDLLEDKKEEIDINLYLTFGNTGKPSYRFFPNDKIKINKRDDFRRLQDEMVHEFLDCFVCKYIPSEKTADSLFSNFLIPHLKEHVGDILQEHEEEVSNALNEVSIAIGSSLSEAGLSGIKCGFGLPDSLFSNSLSKFDFFIDDGEKTSFDRKGSGIQAAVSLASFNWIDQQERNKNKSVIWLIEEPESYLHPALTEACSAIIKMLSRHSCVFSTTHSIGFIPQDYTKVLQTKFGDKSSTTFNKFDNYIDSTRDIRTALGVRFSDYFDLSEYNIFVEGGTDKLIMESVLSLVRPNGRSNHFPLLRSSVIKDFTGVSSIKDFLKFTYSEISKERVVVVIFDGDEAGVRATKELNNYFGNKKIPFESNKDYILLPNSLPIEFLFPIKWLREMKSEHDSWISFECDVFDKVVSVKFGEHVKNDIANWLIDKAKNETKLGREVGQPWSWANDFIKVFSKLEEILFEKKSKIESRRLPN